MLRVKKALRNAVNHATPDIWWRINQDLPQPVPIPKSKSSKHSRFRKREFAATAASLALFLCMSVCAVIVIRSGIQLNSSQNTLVPSYGTIEPTQDSIPFASTDETHSQNISKEQLIEIALQYHLPGYTVASLDNPIDVQSRWEQTDEYDNANLEMILIHTVTFQHGGYQYQIDILDDSGFRKNASVTRIDPNVPLHWKNLRDIALTDANVRITDLTMLSVVYEEAGKYTIHFRAASYDYEYHIRDQDGTILASCKNHSPYEPDETLHENSSMRLGAIAVSMLACEEKYRYYCYDNLVYLDCIPKFENENLVEYLVVLQAHNQNKLSAITEVIDNCGFRDTIILEP